MSVATPVTASGDAESAAAANCGTGIGARNGRVARKDAPGGIGHRFAVAGPTCAARAAAARAPRAEPQPVIDLAAWSMIPRISCGTSPRMIVSAVATARPPQSSRPWRQRRRVGHRVAHVHVDDDAEVVERGRGGVQDDEDREERRPSRPPGRPAG